MDDSQRAYCQQLRPLNDTQLEVLRLLSEEAEKWFKPRDLGEKPGGHTHRTLMQLEEKSLVEQEHFGTGQVRHAFRYRITAMGCAYLEFLQPAEEPLPPNHLTEEDLENLSILPTDLNVLRALASLSHTGWHRPQAFGSTRKTHQDFFAKRLAEKGLIDRVLWANNSHPTHRYRINDNGLRYLAYIDKGN